MNSIVDWLNQWTMGGKLSIIFFALFAVGIVFFAIKMVKYSEVVIAKSKFGGGFVGGVAIAAFASMPELLTEVVQGLNGEPGAGVADDLGANAFSAFAIAISLIVLAGQNFIKGLGRWSKISTFASAGLMLTFSLLMFINKDILIGTKDHFAVGIIPIIMFLIYIVSLFLQYKYGDEDEEVDEESVKDISLKKGTTLFLALSFMVIVMAVCLNISVDSIVFAYGVDTESAGGLFLSLTTSLPEIVAYISLIRRGQRTAAVAALVGSQMFNLGVSIFGDMAFSEDALIRNKEVGDNWSLALIGGLEMLIIGMQAVLSRFMKKRWQRTILPTIAALTYVVGWILILTVQK